MESEQKLENLQKQLATAQEEVKKPFAQEAELAEKTARLAELNSLLNMDERDSSDVLGIDEDITVEVAEKSRQAAAYAGKVSDMASRVAEEKISDAPLQPIRYADRASQMENGRKESVLNRLHLKQERAAQHGKKQAPAKIHEQEL